MDSRNAAVVDAAGVIRNDVVVPLTRTSCTEYNEIFKWLFKSTRPILRSQDKVQKRDKRVTRVSIRSTAAVQAFPPVRFPSRTTVAPLRGVVPRRARLSHRERLNAARLLAAEYRGELQLAMTASIPPLDLRQCVNIIMRNYMMAQQLHMHYVMLKITPLLAVCFMPEMLQDHICADQNGLVHAANVKLDSMRARSIELHKKAIRSAAQRRRCTQGLASELALALDVTGVVRAGERRRNRICADADGKIYFENIVVSPQQSDSQARRRKAQLEVRAKRSVLATPAHITVALDASGVVHGEECRRNRICVDAAGTIHAANIVPKGPGDESLQARKLKETIKAKWQNQASTLPTMSCDLNGHTEIVEEEVVVASNDGVMFGHVRPISPATQYGAKLRAKKVYKASSPQTATTVLCAHPNGYACELEEQPEPGWHFWNPPPDAPEEADSPWINCGSSCASTVDDAWTLVY
jgi:hypothetical protein